ncbi:hypothetical protein [Photorhabdus laumondii]|uniref:hypothetical protein n=1 Tax=Photorhabdus laumondii TaxID=2218628 RepID=UPI0015EBB2BC|nr:hypothetical protein [Photorhabdus laumondii]
MNQHDNASLGISNNSNSLLEWEDIISLGATQLTFIAIRENGKRVAWGGGDTRAHGDYD